MDRGTLLRVWLPMLAGLSALVLLFRWGPGPPGFLRWTGLLLGLLGLAGVAISRYTLGRSFSVRARATELVTTGIYARVRNPIYISGMVYLTGVLLMVRSPKLWIVLPLVAMVQVMRARREARVLEAKFGEAYRQYRDRTWL